jgi:hypothetical protein
MSEEEKAMDEEGKERMDAQRVGKGNILHTYSLQAASKQT